MADVKISQLPAATTPLAGTEEVPLVQGGTTKKATVDDIAAAAGAVTSVTGTAPVVSSGGSTPAISMAAATTSVNGYLTSTDWNTFNNKIGTLTSTDGSVTVSGTGATRDLSVAYATDVVALVRNATGATLTKGTVVYISGATGQTPTVSKALANSDATSAQTMGMLRENIANNSTGYVTTFGLITNIDTSAYTDGAQLYLSGTTAGAVTTTKPYAPTHLVYVGVVEYAHPTNGKILVKVQNGYELDELHNVSAQTPSNGQTIVYNSSTLLWDAAQLNLTNGVTGVLPVANGGTGATSLAGAGIVTTTGTQTLTNKTIQARVVAIADATSITINADTTDIATQANTQAAGTLTINAPTGTLYNGQKLILRLSSANIQTFSWNSVFQGSTDIGLPTASSGSSKYDYVGFMYNSTASKWQMVAKVFGF